MGILLSVHFTFYVTVHAVIENVLDMGPEFVSLSYKWLCVMNVTTQVTPLLIQVCKVRNVQL